MAESEKYRLETIARKKRASCHHDLQQMNVQEQQFQCCSCGAMIRRS